MKILITGGSGFIGNHFVDFMLKKYPKCKILNIDNLSYAALPGSNAYAEKSKRYQFERIDICDTNEVIDAFQRFLPDFVVHLAAESHVQFSLDHIKRHRFFETNVLGTNNILDASRICGSNPKILNVSTDEIHGEILQGNSDEDYPLNPRNPYAASKASAYMIGKAYYESFGLNIVHTACTNNFGQKQDFSKLIPASILRAVSGKNILINDKGQHVRSWINVQNNCIAMDKVLMNGKSGYLYCIPGGEEKSNLEIAKMILKCLNLPEDQYEFANLRACDDLRYSVKSKYIHETGYTYNDDFSLEKTFQETVNWYVDYIKKNPDLLITD